MTELTSLCVYCGSRTGSDPTHRTTAEQLGRTLAERGVKLVFGAGSVGLMGVVADAVLAAGGEAIGVIPHHLNRVELAHDSLTEMYAVDSMHERKQKMFELADAFAVLPGGLGTLDETIEIITWRQLRLHQKPVILLDHNGYWDPLIGLVDHVISQGFANPAVTDLFAIARSVDDIFSIVEAFPPPDTPEHAELL